MNAGLGGLGYGVNNNGNGFNSSSNGNGGAGQKSKIAQKMEKQYFMDKSTLLKHLSPERYNNHDNNNKSYGNVNDTNMVISQKSFNENHTGNTSILNVKIKRLGTSGS